LKEKIEWIEVNGIEVSFNEELKDVLGAWLAFLLLQYPLMRN